MLEALAKARRAEFGDDPKMPNPMRARLHEEIARAGATEEENVESRPSWVTRFWPRVTVAAALATLIVLVPAIWWNRAHPLAESGDLALRDRAAGAADGLNPAVGSQDTLAKAAAVSATEPTVNLADNSQIKIEPAATPASEAEALASSTRVAQGRAATESPSQVTKDSSIRRLPRENPGGTRGCACSRRGFKSRIRHNGSSRSTGSATVISRQPRNQAAIFPTIGRAIFSEQCAGKPGRERLEHVSSSARGE